MDGNESSPDASRKHRETVGGRVVNVRDLRYVAKGLRLVYCAAAIVLVSLGAVLSLAVLEVSEGPGGSEKSWLGPGARVVVNKFVWGLLVGTVMDLAGKGICLFVPRDAHARGAGWSAIGLEGASIVVCAAGMMADTLGMIYMISGAMFFLTGTISFLFYLKRLATYLFQESLATKARSLIVIGVVLFMLLVLALASVTTLPALAGLLMLVVFATGVFVSFRFIRLVAELRRAVLAIGQL